MIDTTETPSTPAEAGPDARPEVAEVADTFVVLMRSFGRAKARFMAAAERDVEWSSQVLLRHLAHEGPMRASAIAESLHSDPSTVSRQVAALVKDGLVERRADPEDGRASILVPTAKADTVIAEHNQRRIRQFAAMLEDWSDRDLHTFAGLLRRFTDDFELSCTTLIPEQTDDRSGSAEGNH
jgi:DNA-binding MarR family transcriptional regulator